MSFHGLITFLRVLLSCLPGVYCGHSVIYSSTTVCGLKGAPVVLPCIYEYSGHYVKGGWYKNGYNVRDHSNSKYPDCSMKIDKLKDYHSGVYYFQFYTTLHITWVTTESGVTLLVTDPPQVKEEDVLVGNQTQTKLTCSTSCSLGSQYVWYKNGQQIQDKTTDSILVDSIRPSEEGTPEGYSCRVGRYRSPAVCAPAKQCWGVTYPSTSICVFLGSSVDIPCTYTYPQDQRIKTSFWFNKQTDLKLNEGYKTHIEYIQNKDNCTLRLKDIRESHSGEYGFKFTTEKGKVYTGWPGVTITVTTLQVSISRKAVTERERVTLTCNATCTLSNALTIVWYNNGQPVYNKHTTRDNKLHLNPVSSEDAGWYSCAVKGHESLTSTAVFLSVRYAPKNVSVSISSLDETEEGSSVTLTCSSDTNPPVHTYTWYMKSGAESLVRGTGESISFNVTSNTSGLYYCEAQNELGSKNSTKVRILEKDEKGLVMRQTGILLFLILISVVLSGLLLRKNSSKWSPKPYFLKVDDDPYTCVQFRQSAKWPLYCSVQSFGFHNQNDGMFYE